VIPKSRNVALFSTSSKEEFLSSSSSASGRFLKTKRSQSTHMTTKKEQVHLETALK
jgi:hypothetical protein